MTTSAHKSDRSPEDAPVELPPLVVQTQTVSEKGKFNMSSEPRTGRLLRTLAATKPGGRLLDVGCAFGRFLSVAQPYYACEAWMCPGTRSSTRRGGCPTYCSTTARSRSSSPPSGRMW